MLSEYSMISYCSDYIMSSFVPTVLNSAHVYGNPAVYPYDANVELNGEIVFHFISWPFYSHLNNYIKVFFFARFCSIKRYTACTPFV